LEITKTTPGKKKHQTLKGFCKVLRIHIILYCGAGDAQQSNINEKKVCTLKIDAPDEFINSTTFQPSGLHQAEDLMVEKMNFNHSSLGSEKKWLYLHFVEHSIFLIRCCPVSTGISFSF